MKKARNIFYKSSNVIIFGLLALLGFTTSCENKVEYGTPSAKFIVNGKVISSDSNEAIENIRVIMQRDTTKTDNEGKYQVVDIYGLSGTYDIQFQDIDSVQNGDYQNLDTVVEFKDPQFVNGDGNWYAGEATKEFNVKLDKK